MKNLDLNKYGVQEMNAEEIRETDGGIFFEIVIAAAALGVAVFALGYTIGKDLAENYKNK